MRNVIGVLRCALLWVAAASPAWAGHIHDAAWRGDLDRVKELVENDPERVRQQDEEGRTPLHLAAEGGNHAVAEYLIARGADVNARDGQKRTALHLAVSRSSRPSPLIDLLLAGGADVNARDRDGNTPLHEAMREGAAEVAKLLVAHGARTNVMNKRGETPLSRGQEKAREEIKGLIGKEGGVFWMYAVYLVGGVVALMILFWLFLRVRV